MIDALKKGPVSSIAIAYDMDIAPPPSVICLSTSPLAHRT